MRACAFFSSRTFHSMKSTISGWSMSRQTILAARRVVPPRLGRAGRAVEHLEEAHEPLDVPPPESFSCLPRMALKLVPVPEPYLKSRASLLTSS
jgi:hypothetical protein